MMALYITPSAGWQMIILVNLQQISFSSSSFKKSPKHLNYQHLFGEKKRHQSQSLLSERPCDIHMLGLMSKPSNPLSNSTAPEVASHPPSSWDFFPEGWCWTFWCFKISPGLEDIRSANASTTSPSECFFFGKPTPQKNKKKRNQIIYNYHMSGFGGAGCSGCMGF